MVRSLWTAASGMNAQQTNVDTIANNLANVNTAGYKSQEVSFKTLLYQNLQTPTSTANGDSKPTNAQVGLGTRVSAIVQSFTQGPLLSNDSPSALAISGDGFFGFFGPVKLGCIFQSLRQIVDVTILEVETEVAHDFSAGRQV